MGIFDEIMSSLGWARKASKIDAPTWAMNTAGGEEYMAPDLSIYEAQSDTYRIMSWIASAVELLANVSATVPFSVKRRSGEDLEDIPNHEFERLLQKPNPLQSRFMLLFSTIAYYKVNGNSYWWLNKRSEFAPPTEIWSIPANKITPEPDDKLFLKGYLYEPGDGSRLALEPWEVVHFQRWNPRSMFYGLSPIEAIGTQAAADLGRVKYDAKLYTKDNGRLPSVLAFGERFNPTQWSEIKQQIRDNESKRQMMLLHGVGTGAMQWLTASMSSEDAQFIQSRTFTKEEIYGLLAPGLASVLAVNATEANAKAGKQTLMEYAVYPMLSMMAQQITNDILPAYGPDIVGEFDDPRVKDLVLEMAQQESYSKLHTVAETRKKFHQSSPLGDERDNLLLAQITPDSGQPEPEAEPEPVQPMADIEPADPAPFVPTDEDFTMTLNQWKRKSLFAIKQKQPADVPFETNVIPQRLQDAIHYELAVCETADDVKKAFEAVKPKQVDASAELKRANDLLAKVLNVTA